MESPQDPASDPGTSSSEPATPGMDKPGSLEPTNKQEDHAGAVKRRNPPNKGRILALFNISMIAKWRLMSLETLDNFKRVIPLHDSTVIPLDEPISDTHTCFRVVGRVGIIMPRSLLHKTTSKGFANCSLASGTFFLFTTDDQVILFPKFISDNEMDDASCNVRTYYFINIEF